MEECFTDPKYRKWLFLTDEDYDRFLELVEETDRKDLPKLRFLFARGWYGSVR